MQSDQEIESKIAEICDPALRTKAIRYIVKSRCEHPDLAYYINNTPNVIHSILQEITELYAQLEADTPLTMESSAQACNALALLQSAASSKDMHSVFLQGDFLYFVFPFLYSVQRNTPGEHLRTASLGVIGSLLKDDDGEIVHYLVKTPIIPICLNIMERDATVVALLATYVLQKILADPVGLTHCCLSSERIAHIVHVMNVVVAQLVSHPSARLLKLVVRCYCSLSENPHALGVLKCLLPSTMKDHTFEDVIAEDPATECAWWKLLERMGLYKDEMTEEEKEEELLAKEMAEAVFGAGAEKAGQCTAM